MTIPGIRVIRSFCLAVIILTFASCNAVLLKIAGVKTPRPKSNQEIIDFVKTKQLDYDYLIRPDTDSDLISITHAMKMGFNSIVVYDSAGNEIGNTNDTTCHLRLRSQITEMLKTGKYDKPEQSKNNKQLITSATTCLSCAGGSLYDQELRPYILFLSFATYIPIKGKLTEIDYLQELKQQQLRDKVTIVLINADIH